METMALKNNIKVVLNEKSMTPYRLAAMLGKRSNHIYTLVNEDVLDNKHLITIWEIAQALGVPIEELVADSEATDA